MSAAHPAPEFDQLLTSAALWLLAGCAGWAGLICAAAGVEAVTRGRLRATTWVPCPRSWRPVLVAAFGVALVGAPCTATASPAAPRAGDVERTTDARRLPVPARPLGPARAGSVTVVVRPGDTLWQLAEVRLRSSTPAAVIAGLVSDVHRRNREVIGPDPDLILPGQRLVLPARPRASQHPSPAEESPRGEP